MGKRHIYHLFTYTGDTVLKWFHPMPMLKVVTFDFPGSIFGLLKSLSFNSVHREIPLLISLSHSNNINLIHAFGSPN
jgi:hypothetical protein